MQQGIWQLKVRDLRSYTHSEKKTTNVCSALIQLYACSIKIVSELSVPVD